MIPEELTRVKQVFRETTGLPNDNNHDPSNIIYAEGRYHLWVTQHRNDCPYDHFRDCKIMKTSSVDGIHWGPLQDSLLPADSGFSAGGVLTANVFVKEGKYYLIYTGVDQDFGKTNENRYVGIAWADHPDDMFVPINSEPIIGPSGSGWDADSVDDVTILENSGEYWLYYKGGYPGCDLDRMKIGLAKSQQMLEGYVRYDGNPLIQGHAFAIWKYKDGFLLLTGLKDGEEGSIYKGNWDDPVGKQSLFWSEDGIHFQPVAPCVNRAAGIYAGNGTDITTCWGVIVKTIDTHWKRYIERFDFVL